ncbi:pyridoxamine 5'-phosphate oxidase family protein [Streptomyces violaceusniger]|uniref:Pyridoxamine 5'-phosphate oxidase N-terminal domain-containing protein n=1 Tax=Streptomyces violaceusniger TaxID=68280 RepID=A0A4D4KWH8_STRVO|nr:hypothetical protein SVIO_008220 [Streptomyces violaceusniger]
MADKGEPDTVKAVGDGDTASMSGLTGERVWRQIAKASFAVLSHVTPTGEPRSSGVLYAVAGRRLYTVVAPDSWKARHITAHGRVAVTVPIRRGGLLALLMPIPPATVSFHATATVHPADALKIPEELAKKLPAGRLAGSRIIEIVPDGQFVAYGLGATLLQMRHPDIARARVPVG